ncbi:MAG: prepilin-type N-terminal cleavage/methylation domain-containing protein [Sedimentisphaerales bacterium]|jgi:prepilin-type processing-associated H-X9-DG protein/prepilin-type N-terminal cleavage/methylation domain-containing protein
MTRKARRGFSLVEMLVVVSTVSVVMAVLMPALVVARSYARAIVCRSNARQLVLANLEYANDNDGFCVPAADDLWLPLQGTFEGGYHRWHGRRTRPDEPFDPKKGPLADYLGDGKVKGCPARVEFTKDQAGPTNFEAGCGGYGYNMVYIGSRLSLPGMDFKKQYEETARLAEIKRPGATLMFADCAMAQSEWQYIEYSFAEPPYFLINGEVYTEMFASPSIHFRHRGSANIGWADGHIEPRPMAKTDGDNVYDVVSANMNLGWFGPVDNTPFELH